MNLSTHQQEARQLREQVESGAICGYCLKADCDRAVLEHGILMHGSIRYGVKCCKNEAKRIQDAETLKQQGIHADMVSGLLRLARIPERFREASFEGFNADMGNGEALATSIDITNDLAKYEQTGHGIAMMGSRGLGKTHLLCAILNQLINKGVPCRYVYAPDFLAMLRDRSKDSTLLDITFRELGKERVIALDDIGVDRDTDWTIAQYTRLIDARYRNEKVTLFATNLGMDGLKGVIGERSMSRLIESNEILQMTGKDRRLGE